LVPDIDTGLSPVERYHYRPQADAPHTLLDEAAWGAHWVERMAMSAAEAVGYALPEEDALTSERPPAGGQTDEPRTDHITSWEREGVTALVAQGISNRQIASELYLSERTVENHLSRILSKLGLASRAEVAAWTTEQRLLTLEPD
jgi:non-specific serine/threonine protein kinase